jgi:hypothetical protein
MKFQKKKKYIKPFKNYRRRNYKKKKKYNKISKYTFVATVSFNYKIF